MVNILWWHESAAGVADRLRPAADAWDAAHGRADYLTCPHVAHPRWTDREWFAAANLARRHAYHKQHRDAAAMARRRQRDREYRRRRRRNG